MSRRLRIAVGILVVAVIVGAIYLRSLNKRVSSLVESRAKEEQARREVIAPPISTPTDVNVKAEMFWASPTAPDKLAPTEIQLPLSADPVERSKQVVQALIAQPPTPEQRTLPASASLLDFYLLPDGTAVADFSESLAAETPSGILSESLAVDSITQTLASNVAGIQRLKILIHGQEEQALAGHLDLTGFFALHPPSPAAQVPAGSSLAPISTPPASPPASGKPPNAKPLAR